MSARIMFWLYLLVIVAGIAVAVTLGVLQR